jgi:hypothetical protein
VYNRHGATDINLVAPLIFETDPSKIATIVCQRVRANPPPALINEELGTSVTAKAEVDNETAKRLRNLLV